MDMDMSAKKGDPNYVTPGMPLGEFATVWNLCFSNRHTEKNNIAPPSWLNSHILLNAKDRYNIWKPISSCTVNNTFFGRNCEDWAMSAL